MAEQPGRGPIPQRVLRCVTHHGCECREWAVAEATRFAGVLTALRHAEAQGLTIHVGTRATCAEHLEHGDDKATEPLAAPSPDVEQRTRAIALLRDVLDPPPHTEAYSLFDRLQLVQNRIRGFLEDVAPSNLGGTDG